MHAGTPIDDVLNRGDSSRQRLFDLIGHVDQTLSIFRACRHDRTPIDEVLNRGEPSRQRLLCLIDAHMKSRSDNGGDGGKDKGDSMQIGAGDAGEGSDFTFVQKPAPISSRPSL